MTQIVAKRVLADVLGEDARVEGAPHQGWTNRVFFGRLPSGEFVVRLNPRWVEYVAEFERERRCMEAAAALGVPGPRVVAVGVIDGFAYMVTERIAGRHADESDLEREVIWRTLGEYAARIRTIPVCGAGKEFRLAEAPGPVPTWRAWATRRRVGFEGATRLVEQGVLSHGEHALICRAAERIEAWDFDAELCHGDMGFDNAIVDDAGTIHVLDWGEASAHRAPLYDLAQITLWADADAARAYVEGFGWSWNRFLAHVSDVRDCQLTLETSAVIDHHPPDAIEPSVTGGKAIAKLREMLDGRDPFAHVLGGSR